MSPELHSRHGCWAEGFTKRTFSAASPAVRTTVGGEAGGQWCRTLRWMTVNSSLSHMTLFICARDKAAPALGSLCRSAQRFAQAFGGLKFLLLMCPNVPASYNMTSESRRAFLRLYIVFMRSSGPFVSIVFRGAAHVCEPHASKQVTVRRPTETSSVCRSGFALGHSPCECVLHNLP